MFPFSSLNIWFTHVLSRKCRKWHLRALVGSFSLKSRMVGRLDNSGAGREWDMNIIGKGNIKGTSCLNSSMSGLTFLALKRACSGLPRSHTYQNMKARWTCIFNFQWVLATCMSVSLPPTATLDLSTQLCLNLNFFSFIKFIYLETSNVLSRFHFTWLKSFPP